MTDYFSKMPWFLKEYIFSRNWTDFTEAQKRAFDVLFEGNNHLLLSAGTSSGKTEAAMFPVITSLYNRPVDGIGALYISPLKALIDDQNERLTEILNQSGLTVSAWHGDVGSSKKAKIRENPQGILQITPESLQAIIVNHHESIDKMFSNLRYVVIDEVHTFMNSTRGLQLLCILKQISLMTGCNPIRIGLSATMSDMKPAERWLCADTDRVVKTISVGTRSNYTIQVHYHDIPSPEDLDRRGKAVFRYYQSLFRETDHYNCIVFVNSRLGAEKATNSLKKISKQYGSNKDIDIHHGSISQELRKNAEKRMKHGGFRSTTVATTTLELGIDVGDLDRIVQIDPPYSCSSFVQRMGRSGRRNGRPFMSLFCTNDEEKPYDHPLGFSINLIKAIALVELYSKEGWVEPISHNSMPFGLLFQQTLSFINTQCNMSLSRICKELVQLYPFSNITESDYKLLLNKMIEDKMIGEIDHSAYVERKGGRIVCDHDFYATFTDDNDYEVKCGDNLIGYLSKCPCVGDVILLGGSAWKVSCVDEAGVHVESTAFEGITKWSSGLPDVHTKIMQMMLEVLTTDDDYDYIDPESKIELDNARSIIKHNRYDEIFVQIADSQIRICPWLGTVQYDSLLRLLKRLDDVKVVGTLPPFIITVSTNQSITKLKESINCAKNTIDPMDMVYETDVLCRDKYDSFVPKELLKKAFSMNRIDLSFDLGS